MMLPSCQQRTKKKASPRKSKSPSKQEISNLIYLHMTKTIIFVRIPPTCTFYGGYTIYLLCTLKVPWYTWSCIHLGRRCVPVPDLQLHNNTIPDRPPALSIKLPHLSSIFLLPISTFLLFLSPFQQFPPRGGIRCSRRGMFPSDNVFHMTQITDAKQRTDV